MGLDVSRNLAFRLEIAILTSASSPSLWDESLYRSLGSGSTVFYMPVCMSWFIIYNN